MNFIKTFFTMLVIFTIGAAAIYGAWVAVMRLIYFPGWEWLVLPGSIVSMAFLMALILNDDSLKRGDHE